jgi:hypothetical protein
MPMLDSNLSNVFAIKGTSPVGLNNMSDSFAPVPPRERLNARTPMRCPICDRELQNVLIRDLGGVTADITWQLHAGECPEHGWFQAEVVSQPPREIFPVARPFGVTRRVVIDGEEIFAFATVWNDAPPEVKRSDVDPLDPRYWRVRYQNQLTSKSR